MKRMLCALAVLTALGAVCTTYAVAQGYRYSHRSYNAGYDASWRGRGYRSSPRESHAYYRDLHRARSTNYGQRWSSGYYQYPRYDYSPRYRGYSPSYGGSFSIRIGY